MEHLKLLDKGLFEYVGPTGLGYLISSFVRVIKIMQSGFLYSYMLMSFIGLATFIFLIYA